MKTVIKTHSMTGNLIIREKIGIKWDKNPSNFLLHPQCSVAKVEKYSANKIQKCVRNRDVERLQKRMKKIMTNKVNQVKLMARLQKKLSHKFQRPHFYPAGTGRGVHLYPSSHLHMGLIGPGSDLPTNT